MSGVNNNNCHICTANMLLITTMRIVFVLFSFFLTWMWMKMNKQFMKTNMDEEDLLGHVTNQWPFCLAPDISLVCSFWHELNDKSTNIVQGSFSVDLLVPGTLSKCSCLERKWRSGAMTETDLPPALVITTTFFHYFFHYLHFKLLWIQGCFIVKGGIFKQQQISCVPGHTGLNKGVFQILRRF